MTRSDLILVGGASDADRITRDHAEAATLVPLSAGAADRLLQLGHEYTPPSTFGADPALAASERKLVDGGLALARSFDAFAATHSPEFRFDGPGPLAGQAYDIYLALSAIATRSLLARAAIATLRPQRTTIADGEIDPWFVDAGYTRQPWVETIQTDATLGLIAVETRGQSAPLTTATLQVSARRLRRLAMRATIGVARRWRARRALVTLDPELAGELAAVRPVFLGTLAYEWGPVAAQLQRAGATGFQLDIDVPAGALWAQRFVGSVTRLGSEEALELDLPAVTPHDEQAVELFDAWQADAAPRLEIDGLDLYSGVSAQLRRQAAGGPGVIRHTAALFEALLAQAQPSAFCFNSVTSLAGATLAAAAHRSGIGTVAYQHGGSYGTHALPMYELMEPALMDRFLSYGEGILGPSNPEFEPRARYVPVGSSRMTVMRRGKRSSPRARGTRRRILWVAEATSANGVSSTYCVEDVLRYSLEFECLARLARGGAEIVYRPFPGQFDESVVVDRLERERIGPVRVDPSSPMELLMRWADLVVISCSSGTTWGEAIVLDAPLLVYCDPRKTVLEPGFAEDLAASCVWARDASSLVAEVETLAGGAEIGSSFCGTQEARARFLERYVLHRFGESPHVRAARALLAPIAN